ncbi:MAG TPA: flavin reductase family protein [Acidimicrobiales bacterium]|nr:flavin reductase family protein [Acidimicrobiales bacterium]
MSDEAGGATDYDRLRRRVMWAMPSGLYLLGSRCGEERNLMTLNWATQVSSEPKCVGVGVETGAVTHRLVDEGGAFALSIVAREDRAVVRRFVKPAVWDPEAGELNGHPVRAFATGAPVLAAAVAYLDCRVVQRVRLGSHTFFVGEVADAGFLRDEDVPVLRMEDTRMSYGG